MNIFGNLFKRETGAQATSGGLVTTTDPRAPENSRPAAGGGNWTERIVTPRGTASLLIPAWYRGVTLIMQTMGQMLLQYQKRSATGGNYVEDRYGPGRRTNYLLQVRPNPLMTASQMQEQIEFHKIYFGEAFVYVERDVYGDPEALWLCTSGSYNAASDTYDLTYTMPRRTEWRTSAPAGDVLHFKNSIQTLGGIRGLPTIRFAEKALAISATGDEQALHDMAKGGRMKLIVGEQQQGVYSPIAAGLYDKREMRQYASEIAREMYDNDVVALRALDKAQVVSQTSQQLQLLESRGYQVAELARLLGIPRIMMMEDQGSNYKMPEHATQEFLLRTIQPRIREHEDELNSKLLRMEDFGRRRVHVCAEALRRLDAKGQAEIDKIRLETGVNSVNELRAQYDLPAIAGGDVNYISANLAELGSEKLRSAGGGAANVSTQASADDGEEGGAEA